MTPLMRMDRSGRPLDERDTEIFVRRVDARWDSNGYRLGDYVEFADGTLRRIAHIWGDGGVQTAAGGSFYLGEGYMTFSGQLFGSVPGASLVNTGRLRQGSCWFFHHDFATAGGGITVNVQCRVFRCELAAP